MNFLSVCKVALVAILVSLSGFASAASHGESKEGASAFVTLDSFTVNLQAEEGQASGKFLQLDVSLQMANPEASEAIKAYMPVVRHRLILLLTSKNSAEISTAEGKQVLIGEVLAEVKKPFVHGGKPQEVSNVFFTSFVTQ